MTSVEAGGNVGGPVRCRCRSRQGSMWRGALSGWNDGGPRVNENGK
jgi:hypothetical protein